MEERDEMQTGQSEGLLIFSQNRPYCFFFLFISSARRTQSFSRSEGKICMECLKHIYSFDQATEGSQHLGLHGLSIPKNKLLTLALIEFPLNLYCSLVRFDVWQKSYWQWDLLGFADKITKAIWHTSLTRTDTIVPWLQRKMSWVIW